MVIFQAPEEDFAVVGDISLCPRHHTPQTNDVGSIPNGSSCVAIFNQTLARLNILVENATKVFETIRMPFCVPNVNIGSTPNAFKCQRFLSSSTSTNLI